MTRCPYCGEEPVVDSGDQFEMCLSCMVEWILPLRVTLKDGRRGLGEGHEPPRQVEIVEVERQTDGLLLYVDTEGRRLPAPAFDVV